MQGVSLVAGARGGSAGFLPVFQIHLRIFRRPSGATGARVSFPRRAEPFDLCATLKGRLLYLRAALSSHQSSARKKSLSRAPARIVCDRATNVPVRARDKTPRGIVPTFIERSPVPRRASFNPRRGGLIRRNPAFREDAIAI